MTGGNRGAVVRQIRERQAVDPTRRRGLAARPAEQVAQEEIDQPLEQDFEDKLDHELDKPPEHEEPSTHGARHRASSVVMRRVEGPTWSLALPSGRGPLGA